MKIEAPPRILAVAGLCAAALIGLVISEGFARESGQEISCRWPPSIRARCCSGHYVQLNFTSSNPRKSPRRTRRDWENWVALAQLGRTCRAAAGGHIYVAAGGAISRDEAQVSARCRLKARLPVRRRGRRRRRRGDCQDG